MKGNILGNPAHTHRDCCILLYAREAQSDNMTMQQNQTIRHGSVVVEAGAINVEPFQHFLYRGACQSTFSRRVGNISTGALEYALEELPLKTIEYGLLRFFIRFLHIGGRMISWRRLMEGEMMWLQGAAPAENHRALHGTFQFAHVARPLMQQEC